MKFIDTHAHVLRSSYKEELKEVIEDLNNRDVLSINISYNMISSKEVMDLYEVNKKFVPVVGVHPCYANTVKEGYIERLEQYLIDGAYGIGEIGMDFFWEGYDQEIQAKVFREQLELAQKYSKPVVIHSRAAIDATYEVMKDFSDITYVVHSWEYDKDVLKKFMDTFPNLYISFNGIITFKNALVQKEVIKHIPLEMLMFETDCPYLSPEPYRGKTNYPYRVEEVIKYCSELLDIEFERLNDINNENATRFFNLK